MHGRGIGSRALAKVVERLTANGEVPAIILTTSVDNAGAIRVFEKAGFRRWRTFEDGELWRDVASPVGAPVEQESESDSTQTS